LLLDEATLRQVWLLRRMAQMISSDEKQYGEGIEKLLGHLKKSRSNTEFLANLGKDM